IAMATLDPHRNGASRNAMPQMTRPGGQMPTKPPRPPLSVPRNVFVRALAVAMLRRWLGEHVVVDLGLEHGDDSARRGEVDLERSRAERRAWERRVDQAGLTEFRGDDATAPGDHHLCRGHPLTRDEVRERGGARRVARAVGDEHDPDRAETRTIASHSAH